MVISMLRHGRLTVLYLAQMLKTRLSYRGDFLIGCLASLLSQAVGLAVVGIIFQAVPVLRGWSRTEVFFIYGFAVTAQALFESIADGFYWFSDRYVIQGELDRLLLRPVDPLFQLLLENFSLEFLPDLVLGIAILTVAGATLGVGISVQGTLLFLLMVLGAVLVLTGLFLALASAAFWAEDRIGLLPPVYNLMAFGRYPLTIYGRTVQILLSWVLPFGFVAFYPSTGFLGRGEFSTYFWGTPLAGGVVFAAAYGIWRLGIRKYQSTGS